MIDIQVIPDCWPFVAPERARDAAREQRARMWMAEHPDDLAEVTRRGITPEFFMAERAELLKAERA